MPNSSPTGKMSDPYGYCPICSAPGETRERRPNGNDVCKNKHTYPSKDALPSPYQSLAAVNELIKQMDNDQFLMSSHPQLSSMATEEEKTMIKARFAEQCYAALPEIFKRYCHLEALASRLEGAVAENAKMASSIKDAVKRMDIVIKNLTIIQSQIPCVWQSDENPDCPHCRVITSSSVLAEAASSLSSLPQ